MKCNKLEKSSEQNFLYSNGSITCFRAMKLVTLSNWDKITSMDRTKSLQSYEKPFLENWTVLEETAEKCVYMF
jgi:hypothetical protein